MKFGNKNQYNFINLLITKLFLVLGLPILTLLTTIFYDKFNYMFKWDAITSLY